MDFNLAAHNCAKCPKWQECEQKEMVDYFRNKPEEFKRVVSSLKTELQYVKKSPAFLMTIMQDTATGLIILMLMGYAKAKKEDSVAQLEKTFGIRDG